MQHRWREKLGKPDIKLAGFHLWIHSRQFPDIDEFWDGNWLNVTAHCGAPGADVWTSGNFIRTDEIERWANQARTMHETLSGKAELSCLEPELSIVMEMQSLGAIAMTVHITPDHLSQTHSFDFEIDQSHLPELVAQCSEVMQQFPIKDSAL